MQVAHPTTQSIHVARRRDLRLNVPSQPGRPAFLSAASGLVVVGDRLYVVADDELALGVFARDGDEPGTLHRLLPGELPLEPKPRKKSKPDFESLLRLPVSAAHPHGALFAMGSGSSPRRCRGVLTPFDTAGELVGDNRVVELAEFLAALTSAVGHVNIEGATLANDRLILLQRGNKGDGVNAIVTLAADAFLAGVERSQVGALELESVRKYDLGAIGGVPLGFTDATVLANGTIVFSAAAEDTDDPIADGACAGAAIGMIAADGELLGLHCVDEPVKLEGLHASERDGEIECLLVTDADDPTIPASLLRAVLTDQRLAVGSESTSSTQSS